MPTLEIITIGTELLLGEITDTNSTYIARTLRDHGIDIYRITTIGDNPGRISSTIKEALQRADIIITTGGLGPTVDDPTRQAVADATGRELVFQADLWEQILERFKAYAHKPTENNRRQAYIPQDAIPLLNPVGTAPCFIVELEEACVISLPGVPREMEKILHESVIPYLREKYLLQKQTIKATVLHAASMGESLIDEIIGDLEELTNPTVGLLAHPGQVDIRVTAKARSEEEALSLSMPIVEALKSRLGDSIYGQDEDTLEKVVCEQLNQDKLSLCLMEYGLSGTFISRLKLGHPNQIHTHLLVQDHLSMSDLKDELTTYRDNHHCDIGFGVALVLDDQVQALNILQDDKIIKTNIRYYGGPRENAELWVQNTGLDFLRRHLQQNKAPLSKEKYETS